MRFMIVLPILLLGACNVARDGNNDTVSVTVNEDVAANTAANVSNAMLAKATGASATSRRIMCLSESFSPWEVFCYLNDHVIA